MGPMEIAYSDAESERQQLELNVINLTSQIDAQRAIIEDLEQEASGRRSHEFELDVSVLYARFVVFTTNALIQVALNRCCSPPPPAF